jgi:hypothetical protein
MLQRLGIEEEEFDDFVFKEEETTPKEGINWMALARVHNSIFFSLLIAYESGLEPGKRDQVSTYRREFVYGSVLLLGRLEQSR